MLTKLFRDPSHGNPKKKLLNTFSLENQENSGRGKLDLCGCPRSAIKANMAQLSKPQSTLDKQKMANSQPPLRVHTCVCTHTHRKLAFGIVYGWSRFHFFLANTCYWKKLALPSVSLTVWVYPSWWPRTQSVLNGFRFLKIHLSKETIFQLSEKLRVLFSVVPL